MTTFPTVKEKETDAERVTEHLKALERVERKLFEPRVKETGVTHTVEQIEARRQERLKRGG